MKPTINTRENLAKIKHFTNLKKPLGWMPDDSNPGLWDALERCYRDGISARGMIQKLKESPRYKIFHG
jgi:hypothetical protein